LAPGAAGLAALQMFNYFAVFDGRQFSIDMREQPLIT
jgi:hypothetical protein